MKALKLTAPDSAEEPQPPKLNRATREMIAFPAGRSYLTRRDDYPHPLCTWNYHPEWEIHFIPEARGFVYVGDYIGSFEPGHIALCGTNLPHNWVSPDLVQRGRDYVLQFDAEQYLSICDIMPEMRLIRTLAPLAERGIELGGQDAREAGDIVLALQTTSPGHGLGLLIELLTVFAEATDRRLLASPGFAKGYAPIIAGRHSKVDQAMQHMQVNPSISMNEVADLVGASPSAFSRSFKMLTGKTFSSYQRTLRISRASTLLSETGRAVTEVCFESGYKNLSNFNRAFLEETGMTPRDYRKVSGIRTTSQLVTDTPPGAPEEQ